ncbi:family 43 glycosylhydrolase [Paenibacillus glycanilyticus]|uniref:LamG-like jellyroll fold domain-containing protein n=1 Tax=Paenibacillus glycanilyticus TaxID=126569 RepID=UPI00203F152E|nr:LamG-like jellyroll fold domain-containing protein [Paenibacillus glycanilyticus]MCM3626628.1 family 43 glycosylhydrolase [Paenibacillus glycanilyticus]
MIKSHKLLSLILIFTLALPITAMGKPGSGGAPAEPTFSNVSVHDPSIVKDGDTYYVFGSHIEAAKSTDLMNWTTFTNGYATPNNVLYGNLSQNLAASFKWAGENDSDSKGGFSVWAPDVFWNAGYRNADGTKGAYMLYYCTSSTYIRSAIGFAVSQKMEGPYTYVDTLVYSGFTANDAFDANSVINKKWSNTNIPQLITAGKLSGQSDKWFNPDGSFANINYPNAIDPQLMFDKNGKLWMSYGSWSGGIFALQIDPATGKAIYPGKDSATKDGRLVDRYFGTKIAGGYYKSGEGPYMVYNKETDFYYLFETLGWLGADGGYNMRLYRSKNPLGPFVDAAGKSAVLPGDIDPSAFGNKLMGNFLFKREVGEPGTGIGYGYVSPGHNSFYQDPKTGRMFLVFHSRFPQKGEIHEVRVHQMFMNKDGWLVTAPYRYSGESLEKVKREDLTGEYKFINHGKGTTAELVESSYITLSKNNKVTGDTAGTWKLTGHNEAEFTLGGKRYKGVFVKGWDPASESYVMTFTAMSGDGVTIWGSKQEAKSDSQVVKDILADLSLGDTTRVIANLNLPSEGMRHAAITWTSSNPAVVSAAGEVIRPASGSEAVTVTLEAAVKKGTAAGSKSFTLTVLPYTDASLVAKYSFENDLSDSIGSYGAGSVTGSRIDNTGGLLSYADGVEGQSAVFDGNSGVRLPNKLIDGNQYSVSLWVKPDQLTTYTTTFFGAKDGFNWVSLVPKGPAQDHTMVWSGSGVWYDGTAGLTIPVGSWTHLAYSVDNGTLSVYVNGQQKFSGSNFPDIFTGTDAVFSLGVNWWDAPFKGQLDELQVYEGALSPAQIEDLVKQ